MGDLVVREELTDDRAVALWLSRFSSDDTRKAYLRDVRSYLQAIGKPLADVTFADTVAYTESLQARYKPASVARKLGTLKSLHSFLSHPAVAYLRANPWYLVRGSRVDNRAVGRILTESEVFRLLAAAKTDRQLLACWLLYYAGMRAREVSLARWRDLEERPDAGSGQIQILGKGGKVRTMLLPRAIWEQIQAIKARILERDGSLADIQARDPIVRSQKGGPMTPSAIWRLVRRLADRAGIKKPVSPHWLRHAHCTHAIHRGAPLTLIAHDLGHESIQTTLRYSHAQPQQSSALFLPV